MKRIHILTTRSTRRAQSFIFPIRKFSRQLGEVGLEVRFFYDATNPSLIDCDILGIVSDYYGIQRLIQRYDDAVTLLNHCRPQVKTLIWFDVTDGTGTLFEPAFSIVDVYAKKQLLKDRKLYRTAYLEREFHLHYYYEHFGDELITHGEKARIVNHRGLTNDEIAKFQLSWNIGLGNYNTFLGRGQSLLTEWPLTNFRRPIASPSRSRPISVSYRVGYNYAFPAVPFHRRSICGQLKSFSGQYPETTIIAEGRLPHTRYMRELSRTQIAPSPFGLGEICWRDFEIILAGALMLKPDLHHLETWPIYFENNITYVAHRWDLQDLTEKIDQLIKDTNRSRAIAQEAQTRYTASFSSTGGREFAERLASLVNKASPS